MRYGFIGLGAMGQHMATNIAKRLAEGDALHVYDLQAARATMGTLAGSPAEVARSSSVIVSSLPQGSHVKSVFQKILPEIRGAPQKLFIDCSTIDIQTSRETAALVAEAGHRYIDAPVSGGTVGAETASLTFMVGMESTHLLEPVLSKMGSRIFACGAQGAGLAAKLANNYILALQNLGTCEGFALAKKLGLDMKTFSDIVNVSSGQSWSSRVNNPVPGIVASAPSSRGYSGGFAVELMRKDLRLAMEAAILARVALPLGKHAPEVYEDLGNDTKDFSVAYDVLVR